MNITRSVIITVSVIFVLAACTIAPRETEDDTDSPEVQAICTRVATGMGLDLFKCAMQSTTCYLWALGGEPAIDCDRPDVEDG